MSNLIKFEFRKLFKSKTFYICGSIGIAILAILIISDYVIFISNNIMPDGPLTLIFMQSSLNNSDFTFLAAIFVSVFVCHDYAGKTIKTIYAKGYSRTNVFLSKYIVSLVALFIYVLLFYLVSFVFSLSLFGKNSISSPYDNFGIAIVGQISLILAYHSLYFFISNSLGNTGGSLAFNILCPSVITLILSLITALLRNAKINFNVAFYWLPSLLSAVQSGELEFERGIIAIVVGIIYTIVFTGAAYLINRKKEA